MTTKPYKSIEYRIFVESGIRDFLVYGGKSLYGTFATFFRVPTFIRKILNQQLWIQREDLKGREAEACGITVGLLSGAVADVIYSAYSIEQSSKGNYVPLAILAATNLLFGAYELGRLSKSRQENLELKAQREAQKLQAQTTALEEPTSGGGG